MRDKPLTPAEEECGAKKSYFNFVMFYLLLEEWVKRMRGSWLNFN